MLRLGGSLPPQLKCQATRLSGPSPAGGAVVPGPHPPFEICASHFTFGPLVAANIQYCILKMRPLLLVFGPPADKPWRL